jgi:iron complex outermembrane receptor protein
MKKIIFLMMVAVASITNSFAAGKTTLTGKITDQKTGEPLAGVSIYITDLKTGTSSLKDGTYKIENLPTSKVSVQISMVGFKLIIQEIDLSVTTTKDFAMEESVAEIHEVVVTGLSKSAERNRTPTPITSISPIQLKELSSNNIIDAIATQPGISQVTTGAGISKPVIRGLGYNRVVVVNDGIRQEGQQWGDEHGIEIDQYGVNRVEILKGPASLAYGSDALAGVINMLNAPILPEGKIKGSLLGNYQTNNGLIGGSANFNGNIKGYVWDVRYSNKIAHDYKNKYDGYVFNSGMKENNFSGLVGVNKSWGYSHLHFGAYNLTPGIVEGERDSATGKFLKPVAVDDTTTGEEIATNSDFKSYTPTTPYQKIHHYKLVSYSNFVVGNGTLRTILGWQQNQRQEYGDILNPNQYGLYFFLNTVNYDIRYNLPEIKNMDISFGINGMYQNSQNKGTEYLIPNYNLFDFGIYGLIKKSYHKLDISGGLRYDTRAQSGQDLYLDSNGVKTDTPDANSELEFAGFNSTFSAVSGSIGATYQFNDNVYTKLNFAKGFRAPSIAEISSNGAHEGSINYLIGVPTLKPENSYEADFAIGFNSEHVTAEADVFYNHITNYIYQTKLGSESGGDSITDGYNTFKYASGNANLWGGEFSIDIHPHPLDWLHFENTFSYVQAVQVDQPDSTKYLPFTPGAKYTSELRANKNKMGNYLANAYFKIGLEYYFKQDKFYAAYGTETATPAYLLFVLGVGTDVVSKSRTLFSLYFMANNIFDVAYQSHLSRLKYAPENNVTGRTGVFNMGRNLSLKVIVPIDFK